MGIGKTRAIQRVETLLMHGERIERMASEVRNIVGGSLTAPTMVFATNKRIIITRRDWTNINKSYKIIKYGNITDIKLLQGLKYCSIHFGVHGDENDANGRKWVTGIPNDEGLDLVKFVNEVHMFEGSTVEATVSPEKKELKIEVVGAGSFARK
ncbi:MAG: PH domain-containing protein [Candidatus Micrarchaeota archaeon]|nr:PH domain-containing protein [Candidatus Micrarchaeota archaeon]